VPTDPGAPDEASGKGMISVSFGKLFEKVTKSISENRKMVLERYSLTLTQGLSLATGQCNVKQYNRYLRDLIISGRAKPSFVVSHEIGIDDAEMAYDKFDKRIDGYTKVLIHPNGPL
jgi:hypothetical protein